MKRVAMIAVGLAFLALSGLSATEQWPKFRGLEAGVIPDDPALPESWSETENIVWKTNIPGMGWSSPIVWDDHIFLTSARSSHHAATPRPSSASALSRTANADSYAWRASVHAPVASA